MKFSKLNCFAGGCSPLTADKPLAGNAAKGEHPPAYIFVKMIYICKNEMSMIRKSFFLLIAVTLVMGCSKTTVDASYKFVPYIGAETKLGPNEEGIAYWEEGDELRLNVDLYQKGDDLQSNVEIGGSPVKRIEAKLVYENSGWSIYDAGKKKVDALEVSMPSSDYRVAFIFIYQSQGESIKWYTATDYQEGSNVIVVGCPVN